MYAFKILGTGLACILATLQVSATATTVKTVVSQDGSKIYAEGTGNYLGPHLILAHGLACTGISFDPLFKDLRLTTTTYMVRFDTRGHGRSAKPLDPTYYESARYAQDLAALVSAFGLKKPVFVGWSLGAAIGADIAANWPHPVPFGGLVWLAGLPYLGDILPKVATPTVLSFLPGLESTDDAVLGLKTRIDFVNTLSAKTDVPFEDITSWVGSATYLPPNVAPLVLGRTQNEARLLEEGKLGWPLLILHGDRDQQINGSAVISNMAPKFKNVETHLIKGGGHAIFYDKEDDVATYLLKFVYRVRTQYP